MQDHYTPYKSIFAWLTNINKLDVLVVDKLQSLAKILQHLHLVHWVLAVASHCLGCGQLVQEFDQ